MTDVYMPPRKTMEEIQDKVNNAGSPWVCAISENTGSLLSPSFKAAIVTVSPSASPKDIIATVGVSPDTPKDKVDGVVAKERGKPLPSRGEVSYSCTPR